MTDDHDQIFFHASPNVEFCKDGAKHDFKGWRDITDERGRVSGGETVCTKCGLGAMQHSLRTGP